MLTPCPNLCLSFSYFYFLLSTFYFSLFTLTPSPFPFFLFTIFSFCFSSAPRQLPLERADLVVRLAYARGLLQQIGFFPNR